MLENVGLHRNHLNLAFVAEGDSGIGNHLGMDAFQYWYGQFQESLSGDSRIDRYKETPLLPLAEPISQYCCPSSKQFRRFHAIMADVTAILQEKMYCNWSRVTLYCINYLGCGDFQRYVVASF
jgi:hypothetical protein